MQYLLKYCWICERSPCELSLNFLTPTPHDPGGRSFHEHSSFDWIWLILAYCTPDDFLSTLQAVSWNAHLELSLNFLTPTPVGEVSVTFPDLARSGWRSLHLQWRCDFYRDQHLLKYSTLCECSLSEPSLNFLTLTPVGEVSLTCPDLTGSG